MERCIAWGKAGKKPTMQSGVPHDKEAWFQDETCTEYHTEEM